LKSLRSVSLRPAQPILGSTLEQLRSLRNADVSLPPPVITIGPRLPAPGLKVER
jgi:hypothetical protein